MRIRDPRGLPPGLGLPLALLAHLAVGAFHRLRGYTSPGTDPVGDTEAAVAYDLRVVERWLGWLERYRANAPELRGLRVLELGPGPDLGAGLILLAQGVASYTALDAHPLATRATDAFYEQLFAALEPGLEPAALAELRTQLGLWRQGRADRLRFECPPDFDLSRLGPEPFDLVLSQAALEHFEEPPRCFRQLARCVRPGGTLVAQVDLKTHTPLVRERDPLSIYRLPGWLYRRTPYPGVPNRVRPAQYVDALRNTGWRDVRAEPLELASPRYLERARRGLAAPFADQGDEIGVMSVLLCATRA